MRIDAEIEWLVLPSLPSRWEHFWTSVRLFFGKPLPYVDERDSLWDESRVLYGLFHPESNEPLYLGKAWTATVYRRVTARDKYRVYDAIYKKHGLKPHGVVVCVGHVRPVSQKRLTRSLLEEIESLLIHSTEPCGNHASKRTYLCREALVVRCKGEWPMRRQTFVDEQGFD